MSDALVFMSTVQGMPLDHLALGARELAFLHFMNYDNQRGTQCPSHARNRMGQQGILEDGPPQKDCRREECTDAGQPWGSGTKQDSMRPKG